jgi:hypothetical protein
MVMTVILALATERDPQAGRTAEPLPEARS